MPSDQHKPISEEELKEWEEHVARGFSATPSRYGRLIAEVRRLRAIYLPLSVRNGGPEGLARYYRQTQKLIASLQEEVRRLKGALESYATPAMWSRPNPPSLTTFHVVWSPPSLGADMEDGWVKAREALGWSEPSEPCSNPFCDGVKDDKNYGDRHRCFKDGRWLDDGSEM